VGVGLLVYNSKRQFPMNEKDYSENLKIYLPPQTADIIAKWMVNLALRITLWKNRKTKLGDFRSPRKPGEKAAISVNVSLNPYAFLITIVHEIAHAHIYKIYGRKVKPHGIEWKDEYRKRMLVFLNNRIFPDDLEREIAHHLKNPKASASADLNLEKLLRNYNVSKIKPTFIDDLKVGDVFIVQGGRQFIKGEKIRTRHKCVERGTNRVYLISGLMECVNLLA